MFGLGWSEMVLISIVALIVVGPKELPHLFRMLGQFTGKARGMAREFSRAMETAAKESGVSEIEKTLRAASNPVKFGADTVKKTATSALKSGGETEKLASKLSEERQEIRARVDEASRRIAKERKAEEEARAAAPAETVSPAEAPASDSPTQNETP